MDGVEPDRDSPFPPGPNTAALFGKAYSRLGRRIVDGVVAAGFPQRPAHSAVFANIDAAGSRLTDLAARANMTLPSMKELVDDLERRGYVERRPDPVDRRAKLITLTDVGRRCIDAAFRTIADIERDLEQLLGPERLHALRAALDLIVEGPHGGGGH